MFYPIPRKEVGTILFMAAISRDSLNFNLLCKCFWTIWLPTNLTCFASCFVCSPLGIRVLEAWKHVNLFHWCSSTDMICINFVPSPVERNLIVSFFYCLSNFCCGSRGMPHTPSTHISFSQHTQAGYCYLHGINHYNLHPLLRFRPVFLKANVLKTSFQEQAGHSRKLVKPWRGTASPVWASWSLQA